MGEADRSDAALMEAAREARDAAYAPYSEYRVGAALEAEDGRVFTGCNVENASYPVGMCAEQAALGAAVTAGARRFRRLALSVSGDEPASPCGRCRQALAEFGDRLAVLSEGSGGGREEWTLAELLPHGFGLEGRGDRA